MSDRNLAFIYTPEMEGLRYPPDCPFKTERAGLTRERLRSFGLLGTEDRAEIRPRQATRAELERFHSPRYLEELRRAAGGELTVDGLHMGLGSPDTPVFPGLFEYGAWAAGAALTAADRLRSGEADVVFSLPGGFHHAMPERAAGFCYLNDVVLACLRLADGGKRVACLDVDAHHGDGTQVAFYGRRDVLTISLHESGKTLFPWGGFEDEIGDGEGRGYNVNLPLPAGTYDEAFRIAVDEVARPVLAAFDPDFIVIELGMDTLSGDPLTHLSLTNNSVVDLLGRLGPPDKPMLVAGGGGYHVENTVRAWALAWQTLAGGGEEHDLSAGLGGVMLANVEWAGGLRDRVLPVTPEQRQAVEPELRASIEKIRKNIFHFHGLDKHTAAGGRSRQLG